MGRQSTQGSTPVRLLFTLTWVLLIMVVAFLFASRQQPMREPKNAGMIYYSGGNLRQVVLRPNHHYHYIVRGYINGYPVKFMMDTGASNVSIPGRIARKIGMQRGTALKARTANGIIRVYLSRIDELEIGPIRLSNIRANINPHLKSPYVLLGMSALKYLEFTHRNNRIVLRQRVR